MENNATRIFLAERLFTGSQWLEHHAAVIKNGKIIDVLANENIQGQPFSKCYILAPAFMDIQIYGAHGKLFSVYPETDSLHKLYDYCLQGGATHFQPTVATNTTEVFHACINSVKEYWQEGGKGCIGLHLEGSWINPQKRGAHIESFIHSPSLDEAKALLDYGKDVITMITLAPEVCSRELIELIQSYGVIISAGHSNATYKEATDAFSAGISTTTHLYNAMSPLQHRAPGMVGAVLDHDKVMCSIVPDGFHVDFSAIRIAKKIMDERLFAITDAVTETTEGPYPHHLQGDKYEANGILSGSALTMQKCLYNLVNHAGIELAEALRMVSLYPAQAMKKDNSLGKVEKGFDASLVMLSEGLSVIETYAA
jgi:N-acetylglucosamine-6-phosphate deacetylase